MTPEHRATLTRALAEAEAIPVDEVSDPEHLTATIAAIRAVLAVPEAGEGGAWESAETFARRHAGVGAVAPLRNLYRGMTAERDAQTADRLDAIFARHGSEGSDRDDLTEIDDFIRDLRGLPR